MKLSSRAVYALLFVIALSSCGGKKVKYDDVQVEGAGGLKAEVEWLKNKRHTIDVRVVLTNGSAGNVAIKPGGLSLTFDGQKGEFKGADWTISLLPNQTDTRNLSFLFSPKVKKEGLAVLGIGYDVQSDKGKAKAASISLKLPVPNKK